MLLTPRLMVDLPAAYATFFAATALSAARWTPIQALMPDLAPETERGSLMSVSMAAGQVGSALGAVAAASSYAAFGYPANSALAACASLATLFLAARYLPTHSAKQST